MSNTKRLFFAFLSLFAASPWAAPARAEIRMALRPELGAAVGGHIRPRPELHLPPGLAIKPNYSYASGPIPKVALRCEEDPLTAVTAMIRVNWLLQCQIDYFVGYYQNVFGDPSIDSEVASSYLLEDLNLIVQDGGLKPRSGRMYVPLFTDESADHSWKPTADKMVPCEGNEIPAGYRWVANCEVSCYTPETQVWFEHGPVQMSYALEQRLPRIKAVDRRSTLERPALALLPVDHYTISYKDVWHDILTFTTLSGRQLKVTPNHPLLDQEGLVREATTFTPGQALVLASGQQDPIIAIEPVRYFGKVYNVQPQSDSSLEQLVVAEGFLSGSSWYQNAGYEMQNRLIFRQAIPEQVLEGP